MEPSVAHTGKTAAHPNHHSFRREKSGHRFHNSNHKSNRSQSVKQSRAATSNIHQSYQRDKQKNWCWTCSGRSTASGPWINSWKQTRSPRPTSKTWSSNWSKVCKVRHRVCRPLIWIFWTWRNRRWRGNRRILNRRRREPSSKQFPVWIRTSSLKAKCKRWMSQMSNKSSCRARLKIIWIRLKKSIAWAAVQASFRTTKPRPSKSPKKST